MTFNVECWLSNVTLESRAVFEIEIILTAICATNLFINVFLLKRALRTRALILESGRDEGGLGWATLVAQFKAAMVGVQCIFLIWGVDRTYVTLGMITHVAFWTFIRYGMYRITASTLIAFFSFRFYLAYGELQKPHSP